jgi:hypothetical protein
MSHKHQDILRWILLPFASAIICVSFGMLLVGLYLLSEYMDLSRCIGTGCILAGAFEPIGWFVFGWLLSIIPVWFAARAIAPKYKKPTATIATIIFGIIPAWLSVWILS